MASVAMGTGGSYKFQGAQVTQIAHCLYCDRCGSFSIGKRITLKTIVCVLIVAGVATAFWYSMRQGALPGAWLACFGILLYFVGLTGVFSWGHRCKKCGNIHFGMDNVLGYPENDHSVLDVPYEATTKYYRDDY